MAQYYYYDKSWQRVGPFAATTLHDMAAHGLIQPDTIVEIASTGARIAARDVQGFVFGTSGNATEFKHSSDRLLGVNVLAYKDEYPEYCRVIGELNRTWPLVWFAILLANISILIISCSASEPGIMGISFIVSPFILLCGRRWRRLRLYYRERLIVELRTEINTRQKPIQVRDNISI